MKDVFVITNELTPEGKLLRFGCVWGGSEIDEDTIRFETSQEAEAFIDGNKLSHEHYHIISIQVEDDYLMSDKTIEQKFLLAANSCGVMIGLPTADLLCEVYKKVQELGENFSLRDAAKIQNKIIEKHNLDK